MFNAQPPAKARTITIAGSVAWRNALQRNGQFAPGITSLPYACWIGNHPSFSPKK